MKVVLGGWGIGFEYICIFLWYGDVVVRSKVI